MSKLNRFTTSSTASSPSAGGDDATSQVTAARGEYLMELSFGTPPVSQLGIVDTGSDLIWIQCQPCLQCYEQDLPIFNPAKSSTYKVQSCNTKACEALSTSQSRCTSKNTCEYTYSYGDSSHTTGDVSTETITFNSKVESNGISFPKVSFGCGHDNAGTFRNDGSGLVGLGGGPLSLVSQLEFGKFSYCLIPLDKEGNYTSKINFGSNGEVSGRGVISTPIVKGNPDTFYFLTLKGVSVGETKIPLSKTPSTEADYGTTDEGNIIIDSGTTLTMLPEAMYSDFGSAIQAAISGEQVEDPSGQLQLCYSSSGGRDLNIPDVMLHFDGGDLVLKPTNTFVQVADGVVCLAIVPGGQQLGAILGNLAQMNYLVGYDTVEGKVSFNPTDCTKQ